VSDYLFFPALLEILCATNLKELLIVPTLSETMWRSSVVEVQLNFGSSYVL